MQCHSHDDIILRAFNGFPAHPNETSISIHSLSSLFHLSNLPPSPEFARLVSEKQLFTRSSSLLKWQTHRNASRTPGPRDSFAEPVRCAKILRSVVANTAHHGRPSLSSARQLPESNANFVLMQHKMWAPARWVVELIQYLIAIIMVGHVLLCYDHGP